MFSKLLKYEFQRTRRYGLAVLLAMLCVGLLGFGANLLVSLNLLTKWNFSLSFTASLFGRTLYFISLLGLGLLAVLMTVFMLVQFYKSLFTDEGCLTFTLPVSPAKILLAKVLTAFIWNLLAAAAAFSVFLLINLPLLLEHYSWGYPMSSIFRYVFLASKTITAENLVLGIINFITADISSLLLFFTVITIGSRIAKKHKIFAVLGLCTGLFILTMVLQAVMLFIPSFADAFGFLRIPGEHHGVLVLSLFILLNAALATSCFFLCRFLLEKN